MMLAMPNSYLTARRQDREASEAKAKKSSSLDKTTTTPPSPAPRKKREVFAKALSKIFRKAMSGAPAGEKAVDHSRSKNLALVLGTTHEQEATNHSGPNAAIVESNTTERSSPAAPTEHQTPEGNNTEHREAATTSDVATWETAGQNTESSQDKDQEKLTDCSWGSASSGNDESGDRARSAEAAGTPPTPASIGTDTSHPQGLQELLEQMKVLTAEVAGLKEEVRDHRASTEARIDKLEQSNADAARQYMEEKEQHQATKKQLARSEAEASERTQGLGTALHSKVQEGIDAARFLRETEEHAEEEPHRLQGRDIVTTKKADFLERLLSVKREKTASLEVAAAATPDEVASGSDDWVTVDEEEEGGESMEGEDGGVPLDEGNGMDFVDPEKGVWAGLDWDDPEGPGHASEPPSRAPSITIAGEDSDDEDHLSRGRRRDRDASPGYGLDYAALDSDDEDLEETPSSGRTARTPRMVVPGGRREAKSC